jgi:divalent metal cation (Fe/Co/Zn/Cd) transporter
VPSDLRRAYRLEYLTIGWNGAEGVAAIAAGSIAGSLALVAFGLDSVIEVFSAVVVLTELRGHHKHVEEGHGSERAFLRLIGLSFFALATYVFVAASYHLASKARPEHSIPGIVLTATAFVTMSLLARAKHRLGHRINSLPLIADSRETRLCSLLSLVTLAGLVLNAAFGWWWADPVAALGIGFLAVAEGLEALTGTHPAHHERERS